MRLKDAGPGRRISVCVFFTYGVGLEDWRASGMLERELVIYRKLHELGVDITLWTYDDSIPGDLGPALGGIKARAVGRLGRGRVLPFLRSLWLPFRHRRELAGFHLFKTNQLWGAWAALAASLAARRPWILRAGYDYYDFAVRMSKARLKRVGIFCLSWMLYRASRVNVVTSTAIRDFACRTFSLPEARFRVLSNYVDVDLFRPGDGNSTEAGARVVSVGRLSPQKNLASLVRAAAMAGVGLDLVGDGPLRAELEKIAREARADVRFLGSRPNGELPELLRSYRAFALVSHFEGVPKTLLEAMSCGCLVVGADSPGIREFLEDGVTGLVVGPDPRSIASALAGLPEGERAANMRRRARQYIIEHHAVGAIVRDELALYREVIGEASR